MTSIFQSLALGLLVGVLSGALGIGGGGVTVPVLVLALGIDQATAQGTSLLAILPTAASGAWGHLRRGIVDLRLSAWLGAGGAVGAVLGALVALSMDRRLLRQVFAVYLLFVGLQTLRAALRKAPRSA